VYKSNIEIRPLANRDEYQACVELQKDIWGQDFTDVVPATIQMVSQRVGGVASGAFDPTGRLVGFVFGISGFCNGVAVHWSDMLAVRPENRRLGIGRLLKLHQRETLLATGIKRVYWSFDPLVAQNAHFNLRTLGAFPVEYVVDMYGDTSSLLHQGLDTDRLIVEWRLAEPTAERALEGEFDKLQGKMRTGPIIPEDPTKVSRTPVPQTRWIRLELPKDLERLKKTEPDSARRWQLSLRHAFMSYLNKGHGHVVGMYQDQNTGRCFYVIDTMTSRHSVALESQQDS